MVQVEQSFGIKLGVPNGWPVLLETSHFLTVQIGPGCFQKPFVLISVSKGVLGASKMTGERTSETDPRSSLEP